MSSRTHTGDVTVYSLDERGQPTGESLTIYGAQTTVRGPTLSLPPDGWHMEFNFTHVSDEMINILMGLPADASELERWLSWFPPRIRRRRHRQGD